MSKSKDRLAVDRARERERQATVHRLCLCCRHGFATDQGYRLCADCRCGEASRGYEHSPLGMYSA